MKRKPYTVQEKKELLKSDAIEKVANSSATYSKEFKVYAVGEYMTGKKNTIKLDNVLIHSDQGFHYTNPEYRKLLKENRVIQSMSRKGNCIDNAPMESFFGHLKDELDYKNCITFKELVDKIDEYMYYYNNERFQWGRNKMTPVQYRSHLLLAS